MEKIEVKTSETLELFFNYLNEAVKFGSIFDDWADSEKVKSKYKELNEHFINFNPEALNSLISKDHTILFGRRGTGKTTYVTKAFFNFVDSIKNEKQEKKFIPVYCNSHLMNEDVYGSKEFVDTHFYFTLIGNIFRSISLFKDYFQKIKSAKKRKKRFEQLLEGVQNNPVDSILELFSIFLSDVETIDEIKKKEDYKEIFSKYRDEMENLINKFDVELSFNDFNKIIQNMKRIWNVDGFVFYFDELSEAFIHQKNKNTKHNIETFFNFIQQSLNIPSETLIFKFIFYSKDDFYYLNDILESKIKMDLKFFNFTSLEIYQSNFALNLSDSAKIQEKYSKLTKKVIENFICLASGDKNYNNLNSNEKEDIFDQIFDQFNVISKDLFFFIQFSTGAAIREIAFILKNVGKYQPKTGYRNKINLTEIKNAIKKRFMDRRRIYNSKDSSLIENQLLTCKEIGKEMDWICFSNQLPDKISNIDSNYQKTFERMLRHLEQQYLINFVTDKYQKIYNIYCYNPGFALSKGYDVNHKAVSLISNNYSLFQENQYDPIQWQKHIASIVQEMLDNQEANKAMYIGYVLKALADGGMSSENIGILQEALSFYDHSQLRAYASSKNLKFGEIVSKSLSIEEEEELKPDILIKTVESNADDLIEEMDSETWLRKLNSLRSDKLKSIRKTTFEHHKIILNRLFAEKSATLDDLREDLYLKGYELKTNQMNYRINYLLERNIIDCIDDGNLIYKINNSIMRI